jgi:phosphoglycerol transferase MdoB-like AlkP superfamily enzyme
MLAGVASLLLSLLFGGFIVYQWVLACEAAAASIALFAYYVRYDRHDSRKSKWPPLLPLSVIGASGAAKSYFVATGRNTPLAVVVVLLAAVVWFFVTSWKIWKAERGIIG